jgi:sugar lactone lactonase YvrE
MILPVNILVNPRCELGEGPVWDEHNNLLYWVDIMAGHLHSYDFNTRDHRYWAVNIPLGAVALRQAGGLVLATARGFALFDPATQKIDWLTNPEPHLPGNRFNDGKVCPAGYFWAGSLGYDFREGAGSLYRLHPDGAVAQVVKQVTISNGMAWSGDQRTMYYIDSTPRLVYAFDYDKTSGEISRRRIIIECLPEHGYPDGMTIDTEDKLWIAHYAGGCVRRWDPATGQILETIQLPVSRPTSCTFGGPDFKTLFITSAWENMTEAEKAAEPLAGAVFHVELPWQGRPAFRFGG